MSSELPDVSQLAVFPSHSWNLLAERLRLAGFDAEYRHGVWMSWPYEASLQWPILLWRTRHRRDAAAYAYRMFILRDPVGYDEAAELLGRPLVGALIEAGMLVRPEPGAVVSVLDLRVFRGLLILCDDLLHQGDAVFGAGVGTSAFCGLPAQRGVVRRALDVGCGAGAVALWLSQRAEHVVATDINPRALTFLKINAALNHITNVEGREVNLLDAVAGETFDIITSQPPYVPAASGAPAATYLYGGPLGDELVSRILMELPQHLDRHGLAMVVFEQAMRDDRDEFNLSARLVSNGGKNTLFIVGAEVGADAYSIRHAAPELRRGIDAFDKAVMIIREHLHNVGIRGVCPALCVLEHSGGVPGWTETIQAPGTLWNELSSATIERLLKGYALLHRSGSELQRANVHLPEGSLLVRRWTLGGSTDEFIYLGLPPGYLFSTLEFSRKEWDAFEALHRGETFDPLPTEFLAKAARAGLIA